MGSRKLNPFDRALQVVRENRERDVNSIPIPFPRISEYFPGIEKNTYTIVTGSSGVGKSQLTDFLFLHTPVNYLYANRNKLDFNVRIKYYTLEMASHVKALQCAAHKIYAEMDYRMGIKKMLSTKGKLPERELQILEEQTDYFDWFYSVVEMYEGHIPPYIIYQDLYEYYEKNGTIHKYKYEKTMKDEKTGEDIIVEAEAFSHYTPNNPNEFLIVIIDHAALVAQQKGKDLRGTMEALSRYLMSIRNMFGSTIVSVNQQAADQEKKDNYRRPTLSGLGDNKAVGRDVDYVLGIYDPHRHNEPLWNGWKIGGENSLNKRYREFIILKNRYGAADVNTDLLYDGTTEMFWELPRFIPGAKRGENHPEMKSWYDFAQSLKTEL